MTILVAGCGNSFKTQQLQIEIATKNLEKNNALIENNCRLEIRSIEKKLTQHFGSAEDISLYLEKAKKVYKLTDSLINYLNSAKLQLNKNDKKELTKADLLKIYGLLKAYRADILQIDTNAKADLANEFEIISKEFDSTPNSADNFIDHFFKSTTAKGTLITITAFQNNIVTAAYLFNEYFNKKCIGYSCGYHELLPLVSQSKSYVKAGDEIEISAGIGAYSNNANPRIVVNGINIPLNAEGVAVYKFKASSKPGNYKLPLEISFTDVHGKTNTLAKQMKYTVVNADTSVVK